MFKSWFWYQGQLERSPNPNPDSNPNPNPSFCILETHYNLSSSNWTLVFLSTQICLFVLFTLNNFSFDFPVLVVCKETGLWTEKDWSWFWCRKKNLESPNSKNMRSFGIKSRILKFGLWIFSTLKILHLDRF